MPYNVDQVIAAFYRSRPYFDESPSTHHISLGEFEIPLTHLPSKVTTLTRLAGGVMSALTLGYKSVVADPSMRRLYGDDSLSLHEAHALMDKCQVFNNARGTISKWFNRQQCGCFVVCRLQLPCFVYHFHATPPRGYDGRF